MHEIDDEPTALSESIEQDRLLRQTSMLDAVADGILIVDDDGVVVGMNPAAEELFGVEFAEMTGKGLDELLPDVAPLMPVANLLERSRRSRGIAATAKHVGGSQIPVHVNVSQSRELQHRRYILVLRDFRPILAAQRRSLETRRLAAIGETMTALAHESRNALQRMQSCLSLIRVRGSADVQELVDDMQDAQDQLQRLYEEIRSFASPTQLQLQSADVGRLLDKTWRQLKVLSTERSLSWSRSQAADVDPVVKADSRRLGQVFRNVLENAIEASPACGRILVSVCDSDQGGEPGVRIAVDDEGPGVPPDTAERVFDLLYTTKPDGTGMGLAIAARIVREHGGEICVGRSDQGGARVEITLPRDPET